MNRATVGKLAGHVSAVFTVKRYFKLLGDHDAAGVRLMPLTNAPSEGLPPGCACVLMAPGTTYEARALNPACRVHNPASHQRVRLTKYRPVTKKRNGY